MKTKEKPIEKHEASADLPRTISIQEIAFELNRSPASIRRYVKDGEFPPAKYQPGDRKPLWMRSHFEAYMLNGQWPKESFLQVSWTAKS